jgi:PIN domain nuclease of toxin-antitoxin system
MKVLVDTHALLWWASGDPRLSPRATALLTSAGNELLLSAGVVWEIAIKSALGRLSLGAAPDQFVQTLTAGVGMIPLAIRTDHASAVYHLPPHHQDPFDRILLAQAQIEGATLLTHDPQMHRYGVPIEW